MQMQQWFRSGIPWIWVTAGTVSLSLIMVLGLLGMIAINGFAHFWPSRVTEVTLTNLQTGETQKALGEITRTQRIAKAIAIDGGSYVPEDAPELLTRYLFKQGNRDQFGRDFIWHLELGMGEFSYPPEVLALERREWGNFYGYPMAFIREGDIVATVEAPNFRQLVDEAVERSVSLHNRIRNIERGEVGRINRDIERLRLQERRLDLNRVTGTARAQADAEIAARRAELDAEFQILRGELDALYAELARESLQMRMANGETLNVNFGTIVRVTAPNDMTTLEKLGEYSSRLWAFLTEDPREANTEGGIFPAIFGTVTMVIIMSILVTPFGVFAAIYLREYATQGAVTRIIRVSVYNLAGVPSIVFGVFGLGFFVYFLGGNIDQLFFPAALPSPTFGTPGLFWASLTLALLTLPVVIVSTEEGLARIPSTIRQGSLALGATKSETLWKVVIPLATPAMMTGLILAIARAAGEVAPLMLVGVVKLAPTLPIDGEFPFIHLERKIMHLGFHIYDVGFQSPNVEAARPLVYATALVLVVLIVVLNLAAISIRNHLREKYRGASD